MDKMSEHIFTGQEAALAYAICAERLYGQDGSFLNLNPSVIPIFVSQLFQSLEVSIKYAGIKSGLFTMDEARSRLKGAGHGIKELATFAVERLGGDPFEPIVMAITFSNDGKATSNDIIRKMIYGDELEETRRCYRSRRLGYAEVADGDFSIITPIPMWIETVKQTAANLQSTADILSQWKSSGSKSKHFAIWLKDR